jgi:hypothetical protein
VADGLRIPVEVQGGPQAAAALNNVAQAEANVGNAAQQAASATQAASQKSGDAVDRTEGRFRKFFDRAMNGSKEASGPVSALNATIQQLAGSVPGLGQLAAQFNALGIAGAAAGVAIMAILPTLKQVAGYADELERRFQAFSEHLDKIGKTIALDKPTTEIGGKYESALEQEKAALKAAEDERAKYGWKDWRATQKDAEIAVLRQNVAHMEDVVRQEREKQAARIRAGQQIEIENARVEGMAEDTPEAKAAKQKAKLNLRHYTEWLAWNEKDEASPGSGGDWDLVQVRQQQERDNLAAQQAAEARKAGTITYNGGTHYHLDGKNDPAGKPRQPAGV